jgi:hypothetical protein
MNTRQGGAEMEIHVREETVLGISRAHDDRTWVFFPNFKINIGEG